MGILASPIACDSVHCIYRKLPTSLPPYAQQQTATMTEPLIKVDSAVQGLSSSPTEEKTTRRKSSSVPGVYNILDLEEDGTELELAVETQMTGWKINKSPTMTTSFLNLFGVYGATGDAGDEEKAGEGAEAEEESSGGAKVLCSVLGLLNLVSLFVTYLQYRFYREVNPKKGCCSSFWTIILMASVAATAAAVLLQVFPIAAGWQLALLMPLLSSVFLYHILAWAMEDQRQAIMRPGDYLPFY